ncbi:MAG TPA: amidohydrolase family protein [Burkholderiales bacterium]|jgi:cytosine/adenosine deaminase-related metal-dependent hydrolase|nr:amidohydrolase family protein [Burkholderiales bacterium]
MCRLCDEGNPQDHDGELRGSRREFLKAATATGAAAGLNLFAARPAAARDDDDRRDPPEDHGRRGRRYIIRGGAVMSMDSTVGDFPQADVLVEGKTIVAVGPNLHAGGAAEIDARGRIVMPGFIDTHHHQFETALRSFLADGILINDGSNTPSGNTTYYEFILQKFAPVYRPQDVYINELFGGLSQLDAGVTTVHDISQIHHSPDHTDAAVKALFDTGRRAALGYFEGAFTTNPHYAYPQDALRIKKKWFSSSDQLVHMIMGGEVYLGPDIYRQSWAIGRQLELQIAAHILSPFGIRPILDQLAAGQGGNPGDNIGLGPDNLFIHMTGMSDAGWKGVKDKGVQVSIAFPIEMNMRHGMPPIVRMQRMGMEPSLSTDVECTMTADFFTQMRVCMNMQRVLVNQMVLNQGFPPDPIDWGLPPGAAANPWPYGPYPNDIPPLLTTRDVLRYATMNGAKHLRLEKKVGSLTPKKEADIIILDATAINVAPLNQVPGAVVSLMERSNVETVIVAGKVRKWKGRLLDVNLRKLREDLEASRDYIFAAAGIPQNLFSSQ